VPKVVDHARRRREIVRAAYRVIARGGWEAATMAAVAAEAGYANGALKPYFAGKDDLLAALFDHVYERTGARIGRATRATTGLAAVRATCREILPLTRATRAEARVVIPFWQLALTDAGLAARHEAAMRAWHRQLAAHLREARGRGEVTTPVPDGILAGLLLTALIGAQVTGTLATPADPDALTGHVEAVLELIAVA
jgi:AcrR family transcriptional regulator